MADRFRILTGDCREQLRTLPDASVDSCVTDPPYELGFMGKGWDKSGIANDVNVWREVLRVLKPGGHLLAFSGTRTYHRMACAIEDAGFEIRDQIGWLYGSGFPKSLDVSKAIDKKRDDDVRPVCRFLRTAMDAKGLKSRNIATAFGFNPRMVDHWAARDTDSQPTCATWEQWLQLKKLLCLSDEMDAEVWRLNGRKGTPGEAFSQREVVGKSNGCTRPGFAGDRYGETAAAVEVNITAPATEAAKQWQGWGTALKPSHENCVWATKPIDIAGTVLQLVPTVCQLLSNAKDAAASSPSSRNGSSADADSARCNAALACNTPADLLALTATWPCAPANASSLSIAFSWLAILSAIYRQASTFTTETASSLITDLRTSSCLLSQITPESITQEWTGESGSPSPVSLADAIFRGALAKLNATRAFTATVPAIDAEPDNGIRSDYIVVARKPLIGTVAENVQQFGTGSINVDGCRVEFASEKDRETAHSNALGPVERFKTTKAIYDGGRANGGFQDTHSTKGRWPANIIHDGGEEVLTEFAKYGETKSPNSYTRKANGYSTGNSGIDRIGEPAGKESLNFGDTGTAARFFYCAKASKRDRDEGLDGFEEKVKDAEYRQPTGNAMVDRIHGCGKKRANHHPTVKPTALMRYLCRLVTPPDGTVLDPFTGSGSTGKGAMLEGFRFIGCELSPDYTEIATARIVHVLTGEDEQRELMIA